MSIYIWTADTIDPDQLRDFVTDGGVPTEISPVAFNKYEDAKKSLMDKIEEDLDFYNDEELEEDQIAMPELDEHDHWENEALGVSYRIVLMEVE